MTPTFLNFCQYNRFLIFKCQLPLMYFLTPFVKVMTPSSFLPALGIMGKFNMAAPMPGKFDGHLCDILQNVHQIDSFLDVIFEFLYRR